MMLVGFKGVRRPALGVVVGRGLSWAAVTGFRARGREEFSFLAAASAPPSARNPALGWVNLLPVRLHAEIYGHDVVNASNCGDTPRRRFGAHDRLMWPERSGFQGPDKQRRENASGP